MGFISFNLNYYREKINFYENNTLTKSDIYEAKQLLKLVDDLADEGYCKLSDALQRDCAIVDRLNAVIKSVGEKPFATKLSDLIPQNLKNEKTELTEYTDGLISKAKAYTHCPDNSFLTEIENFCESIEYDADCAYVFLLRDTLLPYIFFKNNRRKNIYPYLLSRSFLNLIYKDGNVDDIIRAVIFEALENGYKDFESFLDFCKRGILNKLTLFPKITAIIKNLLSEITSEKIMVIETGCYGTFPLLLSALDDRIQFKMYTTVPYLFEIYKNNIFTTAYENIRLFETLNCHNNLFQITDFKDGKFYVSENDNKDIIEKSLNEISCFFKQ